MLFIVSTPIGNLEDISKRALKILEEVDLVLCEDTRRSSILLDHYGIKKRLISYHKFKEKESLTRILDDLRGGMKIALISDAGTPCINDPGQILVDACIGRNIAVSPIPGPCSLIQALVLSGLNTERFQFLGFLPRNPEDTLRQALNYPGTTIAFESPQRLIDSLKVIASISPDRQVAVAREMTKTFEECRRGKAADLLTHFEEKPPKGEVVLLIEEGMAKDDLSLDELVQMLQELHGLSLKEAIKQAAHLKKIPKRDVYNHFHQK